MHNRYETERQEFVRNGTCPLCSAPSIVEYEYWRIISNKYPYDAVAKVHHMILPKAHGPESELSTEAVAELYRLKTEVLGKEYSHLFEALPGAKSIPGHFHLHLMVPKVIG